MIKIFISHAADDKDLVDPFVNAIVRLGCAVPDELIFYSSGEGTGVPSGMDLNAYIRDQLSDDGLVVALITPTFQTRPYCLTELGAAWSRVGNLFPLAAPELAYDDMEGVLKGMAVRSFDDGAALDELHDRIGNTIGHSTKAATWGRHKQQWLTALADIPVASAQPSRPTSGSLVPQSGTKRWGQLFDSFVDAALYTADDSVSRDEILKHLDGRTLVPGRYLYSSDSGADNWIRLCKEPAYRHHRETVEFWAGSTGKEIAALIHDRIGREDIDYVSLGPGDGKKDAHLVTHWLESGMDIIYYPYDISLVLVSRAIRKVREKTPSLAVDRLHIKAVLADFNHLNTVSEVLGHRPSPNVVALLGNSLGNLEQELEFLRELKQQMSNEDILVLEVRLKSNTDQLPELATPETMHFDFGALEHYLGLPFKPEQMTVKHVTNLSSIRDTSTTIVGCRDITFRDGHYDEVKLIYIHEYTQKAFLAALKGVGFEVIESHLGEDESFLVCVLRPNQ